MEYRVHQVVVCLLLIATTAVAFTPSVPKIVSHCQKELNNPSSPVRVKHESQLNLLPPDTSTWIATIDSDIANIPTNEFATVFAGGIAVMIGGLFSTVFVGLILDKKNLYANIVADSYVQSSDDEEFWRGLSEEERAKTQDLLDKLKKSKEGTTEGMASLETSMMKNAEKEQNAAPKPAVQKQITTTDTKKEKKEVGMFSDYGED